ncbi:MFS transporter [Ralstonia pseudosolanacearum]|uniref:MFS transporter n=1 Tax=Ralstonia pseudosolanacearum TaxID=1310165 RepID=UPI0026758D90|nr:MFS transporter [Ralstonia pseudosolanacearum]MDO3526621.1 MFS transporter [Ralstonia pseudosolanacearum]MDO3533077.1 MFS transporter [Ralstonia pseudosolanacearum]
MTFRPNLAVVTLIGCQAVITLGLMVLVPIMPFFLRDLMGGGVAAADAVRWTSIALAAPGVGALLCAPFAGRWCERFGYRRALLLALSLFVASMAMMALSRGLAMFIAGRLLQGASTVGVIVTAFIARVSDPAGRGRALGWQESAVAAGALAGPVLGGVLQDVWSVRPLLLAVAVCTGCAVLGLALSLREPAAPATHEASPEAGDGPPARGLFADPAFVRWLMAGALTQAGAFALVNVFALFVEARFAGMAALASKVGVLHALGWCATLVAGPLWGAWNDRRDPARQFAGAALACALALALMPWAAHLWQIGLLRVLQGACYAALAQSMLLICCRAAPPALQGRATVVAKSAMTLGQLLGPLAVLVVLPFTGPAATLWLTAAMFIAAAAIARPRLVVRFSPVSDPR